MKDIVIKLWNDIDKQNWSALPSYFLETATINWHNTNECFNIDEFVRANSEYPGDWAVKIERLMESDNIVISVVKVKNGDISFHATSFFAFDSNKVKTLDEYWGDDGKAPQWRIDKRIGRPIIADNVRTER